MNNKVLKFFDINGLCSKKNDILLYCKNQLNTCTKLLIYFGGDLQDYNEQMIKNERSKQYAEWNLERTIEIIGSKFEDYAILGIKCSKMKNNGFARYYNFIDYENDDLVKYNNDFDCLQHLEQLICNISKEIKFNSDYQEINDFKIDNLNEFIIIGFSSGCTVLNQIMISLNELKNDLECSEKRKKQFNSSSNLLDDNTFNNSYLSSSFMNNSLNCNLSNSLSTSFNNKNFFDILNDAVNQRLNKFYKKLTKLIFLDLGCNVIDDNVYIRDDKILKNIVDHQIELQIHCTPYQVNCIRRPYIGEQESEFRDKLNKLNANYKRKLYFNNNSSLINHFRLIEEFNEKI